MKYYFASKRLKVLEPRTAILPDYYLWIMTLKLTEVEKFAESYRQY